MQISTRFQDYLIDTLEVRQYMHLLLDPFTNPAIIKVGVALARHTCPH